MISMEMALKMGAKKLIDFLNKKGGKFEFTISEASDWVKDNAENIELSGKIDDDGKIIITVSAKSQWYI